MEARMDPDPAKKGEGEIQEGGRIAVGRSSALGVKIHQVWPIRTDRKRSSLLETLDAERRGVRVSVVERRTSNQADRRRRPASERTRD